MYTWVQVIAGCLLITIVSGASYDYCQVLEDSLLFYEAQRSGIMTDETMIKLNWKEDSAWNDTGEFGEDLVGGYYNDGDHLKVGLPMAFSLTVVAWGYLEYPDAYDSCGQTENLKDMLRWGAVYLNKTYPDTDVLYYQVGTVALDHSEWVRAQDMTMDRPALRADVNHPASDVAAESAAALAAISMVLTIDDPDFAAECVSKAEELYDYAINNPGSANTDTGIYQNPEYKDELVWAMTWLYEATNTNSYKVSAMKKYRRYKIGQLKYPSFNWQHKNAGAAVLQSDLGTRRTAKRSKKNVAQFLNMWMNEVNRTSLHLAYAADLAPLRESAGSSFIALLMGDRVRVQPPRGRGRRARPGSAGYQYRQFAMQQIHYMLGDTGRSYVVGFGVDPPLRPYHRDSSCPIIGPCNWDNFYDSAPNPITLTGALVGGPDELDDFPDNRTIYNQNSVALDYNAAFQSAIAGLKHLELAGDLPATY